MNKYILSLVFTLCISALNLNAQNKSMKSIKQEKQTTQKEIKETSQKIKQNTTQTKKSLNQLNFIVAEIKEKDKAITTLTIQLDTIDNQIQKINDTISIQEKRLEQLRSNYTLAIKKMHSQSGAYGKMMFLFSADSFRQAYRRMRYLQQFSRWREKQAIAIKEAQSILVGQRNKLLGLHNSKEKTLTNVSTVQKDLEVKKTQQTVIVNSLKKEGSALKTLLKEKERQSRALDRELDRLIAEEERKAAERARIAEERRIAEQKRVAEERRIAEENRLRLEEEKRQEEVQKQAKEESESKQKEESKPEKKQKPVTPKKKKEESKVEQKPEVSEKKIDEAKTQPIVAGEYNMNTEERNLSGNFEDNKGRLLSPVTGSYKIVKGFGRQRHPELRYVETDNGGIDIETATGASARAIFDGKVSAVFRQDGFNTVVMVRHGNYLSIYVNLSDIYVKSGQTVKAGQAIGKIFSDPEDDNRTILHFEIRKEKVKLNPELWIK